MIRKCFCLLLFFILFYFIFIFLFFTVFTRDIIKPEIDKADVFVFNALDIIAHDTVHGQSELLYCHICSNNIQRS